MNIPITDPRTLELQAGERTIDLARMLVGMQIDPDEMVVHIAVYHPELAAVSAEQQHFVVRTALNAVAGHNPPRRYGVSGCRDRGVAVSRYDCHGGRPRSNLAASVSSSSDLSLGTTLSVSSLRLHTIS